MNMVRLFWRMVMSKARIISGELEGVEFEVSEKTIENIKRENSIPRHVNVGQIYQIYSLKYMVASLGGDSGLTVVDGSFSGCYSSSILTGSLSDVNLRSKLIGLKARYLGDFNDVFKEK
jgi:hypothetical protein